MQSTMQKPGDYYPELGPDPRLAEQRSAPDALHWVDYMEETYLTPEEMRRAGSIMTAAVVAKPEDYNEVTGAAPAVMAEHQTPDYPTGLLHSVDLPSQVLGIVDKPTRFMGVARKQDATGRFVGRATVVVPQHQNVVGANDIGGFRLIKSHRRKPFKHAR